ncbi:prephenate dehydrogenase [Mariniluteicoccus flavus]
MDSPVVVIGAGLVGASVGCALTAAGREVHLRDAVPAHVQVAASLGAGSEAEVDPDDVALVVVAVPPRALADVVAGALAEFPNAVVTDVGSVKRRVLAGLQESGVPLDRYVGSHPMAGSHVAGPVGARADLFVDRTWVVTPHAAAAPHAVDAVRRLATDCGARLVTMHAAEHDVAVAAVSHLPHAVSALVAAGLTDTDPAHLALAGQGLRDVTRIAAGDPDLWEQILTENAEAVGAQLDALAARLEHLASAVRDGPGVREALQRGVDGTRAIPGKHGAAAVDYAHVSVEIPDEPGSLGRLFRDADEVGVNIEDIAIDHDPVRQIGHLELAVAPDRAAGLADAMRSRGWAVDRGR